MGELARRRKLNRHLWKAIARKDKEIKRLTRKLRLLDIKEGRSQ